MSTDVLGDIEWFRENRKGEPIILTLYHGTTHEFSEFSPERVNPENMFGRQFYFTSSEDDAERNYATESGPDLKNRIEHAAELAWNAEEHETHEEALAAYREMFYGGRDAVLTVEITLRNPAILGQGAEHGLTLSWEDAHAEALEAVANELGQDADRLSEDDDLYQQVLDRADAACSASQEALMDKIEEALDRLNITAAQPDAAGILVNLLTEESSLDAVLEAVKNKEPYIYLFEDENYLPTCAPVLCELLHLNGHDAIIRPDADKHCRNMEMEPGTAHIALSVDHAHQVRILDRRELDCGPDMGM